MADVRAALRRESSLQVVTDLLDLRPTGTPRPRSIRLGAVPGRSGPRFLVPVAHRRAAAAACLAYNGLRPAKVQVSRGVIGLALAARLGRVVAGTELTADVGPDSLLGFLGELLDEPDVAPGIGLGRLDEVWKPTLQLFRPDGEPLAFVKIGLGPVAARLVTTEAEVLARWDDHPDPRLVVPHLLAATSWQGLPLAVVAPLPADARRLPPGPISAFPVRRLDGPEEVAGLADAPWWTGRRAAVADDARLDALLATIEARHATAERTWARWHGDWVPWNLGRCHRGLIAWDWEYSEPGAPVGLDEVHAAYQQVRVVAGGSVLDALAAARAAAPSDWVADAHVAMLATRSAELGRLAGAAPHDQAELLAAAEAAIGTSS